MYNSYGETINNVASFNIPKLGKRIRFLIMTLCMLFTLIITYDAIVESKSTLLIICPIICGSLLNINKNIWKEISEFNVVQCFFLLKVMERYMFYPLVCVLASNSQFFCDEYIEKGTYLFMVEMIFVLTTWYFANRKYAKRYVSCFRAKDMSEYGKIYGKGTWLIWLMVIITIVTIPFSSEVTSNFSFIFSIDVHTASGTDFSSILYSLLYILYDTTRILVPLPIIYILYKRYCRKHKSIYIGIAFVISFFPFMIIKNLNRGSAFFVTIIYILIIIRLFGWKKSKYIAYVAGGISLILLSVVSSIKQGVLYYSQTTTILEKALKSLEYYSLGVKTLGYGIQTNELYNSYTIFDRINVLFTDTFGNLPVINRFFSSNHAYSYLYNSVVYMDTYNQNDCIAPLISSSLFTLYAPIGLLIPCIFTILAVKLSYKNQASNNINEIVYLSYLGYILVAAISGSYKVIISLIVWSVFPMYVVLKKINFANGHNNLS